MKGGKNRQILWEASSSLVPGVRYRLVRARDLLFLELARRGAGTVKVKVPKGNPFDLPLWFSSVLAGKLKQVSNESLTKYEQEIRRLLPGASDALTVCLGPRREASRSALFHFGRQNLRVFRTGSVITLVAIEVGTRFVPDPKLLEWNLTIWATSSRQAELLEARILNISEPVICHDQAIVGILAVNAERWEVVGLEQEAIEKLALEKSIHLRTVLSGDQVTRSFRAESSNAKI